MRNWLLISAMKMTISTEHTHTKGIIKKEG